MAIQNLHNKSSRVEALLWGCYVISFTPEMAELLDVRTVVSLDSCFLALGYTRLVFNAN